VARLQGTLTVAMLAVLLGCFILYWHDVAIRRSLADASRASMHLELDAIRARLGSSCRPGQM
jgi:dihydropteroate synthase